MNAVLLSIKKIITKKDATLVTSGSAAIFFIALVVSQTFGQAVQLFSFQVLPFFSKVFLFLKILFDVDASFTTNTLLVAILGSLLAGVNMGLAYVYMKERGEALIKSGLYSGVGLVFAFLGIGCAACGTAVLSLMLSFFGFSAMLSILPYQGQEIGYIGIMLLLVATYVLAKKVSAPLVC